MAKGDFQKEYDRLMSINDYRGLANLLRNTTFKTDSTREKALRMAEKYEEEADIDDKLLSNATQRQKDAYYFISNGPTKSLDDSIPTDEFSKRFADAWNELGKSDVTNGYKEGTIHVNVNAEGALDDFINGSGITREKFNDYGIVLTKGGALEFKTDNPNKVEIFKGLSSINIDRYRSYGMGPGYTGASYTDLFNDGYKGKQFKELMNLREEANSEYQSLIENAEPYILETVVTGYMGEDDKRLQEAFAAGAFDLQTFKEARSILEEKYNRMLQNSSLTQLDVWGMNEDNKGSEYLEQINDNILRAQLDDEINQAMADGRLHYAHASNGLMYGTMITIDQKLDKNGNADKKFPARKLFVKDLFRSQAENSLRDDTQTDAQLKYAKHQTYGHTYRTQSGARIENWTGQFGDSADYIDEYGNVQHLGKAELLNIMDDDIIARRIIDYYKKATYTNNQGNLYTEESKQVFGNNERNDDVLVNNIKERALIAMKQKYSNNSQDYINLKANKLSSIIMQALNLNLE